MPKGKKKKRNALEELGYQVKRFRATGHVGNSRHQQRAHVRTTKEVSRLPPGEQKLRRGGVQSGEFELSNASTAYLAALKDPFDAPLTCVPSFPPLPSFKVKAWAKGTVAVGTSGYGYVQVFPQAIVTNNVSCVGFSGVTYALTTFPVTGSETGVTYATSNAPYANSAISENLQWRLVAVGLRVWPIMAESSIGGLNVALVHPNNSTLTGFTYANITAYPTSRQFTPTTDREVTNLTWMPTQPSDLTYSSTAPSSVPPTMGVLFQGAASTAAYYAYEVFGQMEYIGSTAPSQTMSESDPQGFSAVLSATESSSQITFGNAGSAIRDVARGAITYLKENSGPVIRSAGQFAGHMARAYMSGGDALPTLFSSGPATRQITLPGFGSQPVAKVETPKMPTPPDLLTLEDQRIKEAAEKADPSKLYVGRVVWDRATGGSTSYREFTATNSHDLEYEMRKFYDERMAAGTHFVDARWNIEQRGGGGWISSSDFHQFPLTPTTDLKS